MRRGGGLYGNFVSASDEGNRPYRGAEIPPPTHLGSDGRKPGSGPSRAAFNNPTPGVSKHGYSTISAIASRTVHRDAEDEIKIKRNRTEEEYFDDDDDEVDKKAGDDLPYQPAPGSPGAVEGPDGGSDSEEDPLDAFMANLEKDVQAKGAKAASGAPATAAASTTTVPGSKSTKGIRDDIEEADDEESYYQWLEDNPQAGRNLDEDDEAPVEYDADGNPIAPPKSKYIDPLPPIDHGAIEYRPFERNFYSEHPDIAGLSRVQVIDLRQKLGIHVAGASPPKPVSSFGHFNFDEVLLKSIRRSEFTQPTPIQAQAIPALMQGRDCIGIAKTGSGKTVAFLWPMLIHISKQRPLLKGEGPIGLILVPTRELALQIYTEARKFGKVYNLQVVCAYGGGSKWEQSKAFEAGAEIAIATPGRMIDMIKMKVTHLERVTYLVLDEADRMFNMGFEPQVRSICDHVRPDRQCSLFSATFKKKIERLARDVLVDPVKIVQGNVGEASEDVVQVVKVLGLGGFKWKWLLDHLVEFTSLGSVLIFVTKKQNCEELANNLKLKDFQLRCIHGDLLQHERNEIIHSFKKQQFNILVATDVAARGLDIPHIRTVINFDVARDIDTHTHRIGRTGRAGVKGHAYTLITEKDKEFAGHIVRNLEAASQDVPKEVMDLALKSSWFKSSRFKQNRFKSGGHERIGLGFGGSTSSNKGLSSTSSSSIPEYLTSTDPISSGPCGSSSSDSGGVATGRLSAVRLAFKNQYASRFTAASSAETGKVDTPPAPPPQEESKRKRKSRWE